VSVGFVSLLIRGLGCGRSQQAIPLGLRRTEWRGRQLSPTVSVYCILVSSSSLKDSSGGLPGSVSCLLPLSIFVALQEKRLVRKAVVEYLDARDAFKANKARSEDKVSYLALEKNGCGGRGGWRYRCVDRCQWCGCMIARADWHAYLKTSPRPPMLHQPKSNPATQSFQCGRL